MAVGGLGRRDLLAFLYGLVVPTGALYGLVGAATILPLPASDATFFALWLPLVFVPGVWLVASVRLGVGSLVPGATLGVVTAFVIAPSIRDDPTAVEVALGAFAVLTVLSAAVVGLLVARRRGAPVAIERDAWRHWLVSLGFLFAMTLVVLIVDSSSYWYQTAAFPQQLALGLLLTSPAIGFGVAAATGVHPRPFLTAAVALPFVTPFASVPEAFVFDEGTVVLAGTVAGGVALGVVGETVLRR
ncbi:hypothetical protein [Salinilacihabitans rarus]|uniref:hypothetical protein n=1 Tax=Salinilacihabitans rarus TaxID=2961596 RepID=UPI0020C8DD67|nr:hypothetical protein [Salinilacihabitans rarus]